MDTNLPVELLKCVKQGQIRILENGKESVELRFKKYSVKIDLIDLSFNIPNSVGLITKLSDARKFAEELCKANITLYVTNKGKPVLKLGRDAKPKLSRLITSSKSVEIESLRELRHLDKRLRLK